MKSKIIILCCLVSQLFFAQKVHYSGTIIDQHTKDPVFGVSIIHNGNEITYSNELGIFEFTVDKKNVLDSISFKHISYEKHTIALAKLKAESNTIKLKNSFIALEEVVISATKTPDEKIVDRAIKKYHDNYRKSGYWTSGNYKQLLSYKANPCGYFEIMGNIYQTGTNYQNLWRLLAFVPNEVRRTKEDNILSNLMKVNQVSPADYTGGLFAFIVFARYRFFEMFHPLNEKGKKRFKYIVKTTEQINGKEYYVISYKQKRERIKIQTRSFLEAQGEIWVDKDNYSMLKLTVSFNFEDISSNNFSITYEEIDDELFPNKIDINNYFNVKHNKDKTVHIEGMLEFNNKKIVTKQYEYMHSGLIMNRSFSNIPYNQSFWKKYPIKEPKLKKGLLKIIGDANIDSAFEEGAQQKVYTLPKSYEKDMRAEENYENLIKTMKKDLK